MFGLSTTELIVIVFIILLLFGGKKIPELMKGLGKGVKSFKEGLNEIETDLKTDDTKADTTKSQAAQEEEKKTENA
ncbi:twin-arginine translocase TatA/TatE family subunit [Hallella bergensis]|uniref:Sec-independent protein translocase subunit TatA/TatB n=1 Tax=Hallella bergensis TaxID=242750 RepID=UPI003990DB0A